ncbi:MAG: tetratricopeptide repeat protein [Pseudomonadales bacterium]|nr:tetratricopeptide repeat protein [Pseudomonadales bacterium]
MKLNLKQLLTTSIVAIALAGCASSQTDQHIHLDVFENLVLEGQWHEQHGRTLDAIGSYMAALNSMEKAEIWQRVSALHIEMGEEFPAMAAFDRAIRTNPSFAPAYEDMGLLFLHWKQKDQALTSLEKALELDANLWRAHNAKGIILDLTGDHASAEKHFQTALQLNPGSADLLNNFGYSKFLTGQDEQAQALLLKAIEASASHEIAAANLAKVMARQGDYANAFNLLERNQTTATAYHDVGYIALLNSDWVRAEDYFSKAMHASPQYFDEAFRNRTAARNRLIGNGEGSFVARQGVAYPYCLGSGVTAC